MTAENWQTPDYLRWSFQHVAELFPTATISRGGGPVAELAQQPADLGPIPVLSPYLGWTTVAAVVATTWTDGWLVMQHGRVLTEQYPDGMPPHTRHLLMSVSKSLVGCVVAALSERGILQLDAPVSRYVPELVTSGYAGATLRHLLDMRSGIMFSEDYLDPDAEVRLLEQAIGWAPRRRSDVPGTMYGFLAWLRAKGPHGGPFEYRSCESDLLGWVCEAATGIRMPELMSQLLWARIGAEWEADIGIDSEGTGMFDGGISCTLRDLARFGQMLLDDGRSLTGERVVPESWLADSYAGGPDSRQAFADSPGDNRMPGGMYRNQFWLPFPDQNVLVCLGIHGQLVYVNPAAGVVIAKVSSWPLPQNAIALFGTLAACNAIATTLSPVQSAAAISQSAW